MPDDYVVQIVHGFCGIVTLGHPVMINTSYTLIVVNIYIHSHAHTHMHIHTHTHTLGSIAKYPVKMTEYKKDELFNNLHQSAPPLM